MKESIEFRQNGILWTVPNSAGEKKWEGWRGEGPQAKNGSLRENGLCPANFFKFFWKNDLRFSRSLRKKGADSENHPLFSDIHTSDFARSLPRCNPNFSHTKVAILGGIQQSVCCGYRMKKGCSSIQHPFFSKSMKSANRFFEIFRKKVGCVGGASSFALVGKLASRKGWGRKGETKKERTYQK